MVVPNLKKFAFTVAFRTVGRMNGQTESIKPPATAVAATWEGKPPIVCKVLSPTKGKCPAEAGLPLCVLSWWVSNPDRGCGGSVKMGQREYSQQVETGSCCSLGNHKVQTRLESERPQGRE